MFIKTLLTKGMSMARSAWEDFDNNGAPIVRTFSGRKIFVTSAEWTVEEEGKVLAKVEQLPLRLVGDNGA